MRTTGPEMGARISFGALAEDVGDGRDHVTLADLVVELDAAMRQPAALRTDDVHRADDVIAAEALGRAGQHADTAEDVAQAAQALLGDRAFQPAALAELDAHGGGAPPRHHDMRALLGDVEPFPGRENVVGAERLRHRLRGLCRRADVGRRKAKGA